MRAQAREHGQEAAAPACLAPVIWGAGAAAAGAAALAAALGRAVTGLLGEEGQYDLVVHVREHSRDDAAA